LWFDRADGYQALQVTRCSLDGGFLIAGRGNGSVIAEGARQEANGWMLRLNPIGDVQWRIDVEGSSSNGMADAIELEDHSYVAAGSGRRDYRRNEPGGNNVILAKTEPDPLVYELAPLTPLDSTMNFGEVYIDSLVVRQLTFTNSGLRFGEIYELLLLEGSDVFAVDLDTALRLYPGDTASIAVGFLPCADTTFSGVIRYVTGTEIDTDTIEIALTGRGIPPNAVDRDKRDAYPMRCRISRAYPNPFNGETRLTYELPSAGSVRMAIFDETGREVARLLNDEPREAGRHQIVWNSEQAPARVYICRLESGTASSSLKLVITK